MYTGHVQTKADLQSDLLSEDRGLILDQLTEQLHRNNMTADTLNIIIKFI